MDDVKTFALIDHLKLMGFGESDSSGCWVKWQITPEQLEAFRGRKGQLAEVAVRFVDEHMNPIPVGEEVVTKSIGGDFFRTLLLSPFFHNRNVLERIGSDGDYQDWVRQQRSAIDGDEPCVYAHVRRAGASGTGFKPLYTGVPLTDMQHKLQHQGGEADCLSGFMVKGRNDWAVLEAKEWFDKKAHNFRREWASKRLASLLGYDSRKDVPPEKVFAWAKTHDVEILLPAELRGP